ncbi:MAG: SDR family NAD(P)-dependent oxidoreductase [Candidatus Micrarchaeia archaeon]|jgi:nucleoside-diphosphate-sugar epimerase
MAATKNAKTVLLTGATGRLGRLVAAAFLGRGWRVRALVRNTASAKAAFAGIPQKARARLEFFEADFSQAPLAVLAKACAGTAVLVHAAAAIREADLPKEEVWKTNLVGTKNLLAAAKKAKAGRFVFISSTNVYGPAGGVVDESRPHNAATEYAKSKAAAERAVSESGLEFVILRPCQIYGKGFEADFARIISAAKRGKRFVVVPSGKMHLVHSSDVVDAVLAASSVKSAANKDFIVTSGEDVSNRAFANAVARQVGAKPPRIGIPFAIAFPAAFAASKALSLLGKKSGFTPENVREAASKRLFSIAKAEKLLGWKPKIRLEAGLKEMLS